MQFFRLDPVEAGRCLSDEARITKLGVHSE